jgi:hypothetical protein
MHQFKKQQDFSKIFKNFQKKFKNFQKIHIFSKILIYVNMFFVFERSFFFILFLGGELDSGKSCRGRRSPTLRA